MNRKDRESYLNAMIAWTKKISDGALVPIVVEAYLLFCEACRDENLPHHFSRKDGRRITSQFGDDYIRLLAASEIYAFRMPSEIVLKVGHKRPAKITDSLTKEWYRENAGLGRSRAAVGFAIFGVDVATSHAMLEPSLGTRSQHLITGSNNHKTICKRLVDRGIVDRAMLEAAKVEEAVGSICQEDTPPPQLEG